MVIMPAYAAPSSPPPFTSAQGQNNKGVENSTYQDKSAMNWSDKLTRLGQQAKLSRLGLACPDRIMYEHNTETMYSYKLRPQVRSHQMCIRSGA